MKDKIRRAAALFRRFSGHEIRRAKKVKLPDDEVTLAIGKVCGIIYETVRDGKRETYLHEFKAKSRPLLAVSYDGKQLFLLGGAYNFTGRGIVDRRRKRKKL
jgi:hypothetical protein